MSDPLDAVFVTSAEATILQRISTARKLATYLERMPVELRGLFAEQFQHISRSELAALRVTLQSWFDLWSYICRATNCDGYLPNEQNFDSMLDNAPRYVRLRATVEQLTAERDAFAAENDAVHRAVNEICGTDTSTIDAVQHVVERCNEQARKLEQASEMMYQMWYCVCENHKEQINNWLAANAPQAQRVTVEDERMLDE